MKLFLGVTGKVYHVLPANKIHETKKIICENDPFPCIADLYVNITQLPVIIEFRNFLRRHFQWWKNRKFEFFENFWQTGIRLRCQNFVRIDGKWNIRLPKTSNDLFNLKVMWFLSTILSVKDKKSATWSPSHFDRISYWSDLLTFCTNQKIPIQKCAVKLKFDGHSVWSSLIPWSWSWNSLRIKKSSLNAI